MNHHRVRDIGVPVRGVTHVLLFAGSRVNGEPCLYATMGQVGAPFFVVAIDVCSGHCEKYLADVTGADEAVSAHWSVRHRRLFAGSCYAGHLHGFDPAVGRLADLGAINPADPEAAIFPCGMDEHPDGSLYIGSYGKCDLTRYDPDAATFTNYGRMDPVDMYLYPLCGADGTVAARVGVTRPHVVAFDPRRGEHRTVGPVADKNSGEGHIEFFKGQDGLLYLRSHAGQFRIEGLTAVPVASIPPPMPPAPLPDGTTARFIDADVFAYRRIELATPNGVKRELTLDWVGDGSNLFFCHLGPDGKVYGSSMLPEHLFSYDPSTDRCEDHGACSLSGGEAYSMANLDGNIYIGSYPAARLSVYDPARPYRFGTDPDANPRDLGRMDEVAYRPRAMVAGPAGKVWVGSLPDYGMWGGTLAWYDPRTGRFGSHRHLIQDCSVQSLTWLAEDHRLLAGLAVEGGTGTQPRAQRAGLVLWDPERDAADWQGDFGLDINAVYDLCAMGDGWVYALILPNGAEARPGLYLLDARRKIIVDQCRLDDPPHGWTLWGTQCLFIHQGAVYGATYRGVFRAPLGTTAVDMVWAAAEGDAPGGGGAVVGDQWIFPTRHRLRMLPLPRKTEP